jgi:hypothetical protein
LGIGRKTSVHQRWAGVLNNMFSFEQTSQAAECENYSTKLFCHN